MGRSGNAVLVIDRAIPRECARTRRGVRIGNRDRLRNRLLKSTCKTSQLTVFRWAYERSVSTWWVKILIFFLITMGVLQEMNFVCNFNALLMVIFFFLGILSSSEMRFNHMKESHISDTLVRLRAAMVMIVIASHQISSHRSFCLETKLNVV